MMTKMISNFYYQPSGNLCGPTCIFMVHQLKLYPNATTSKPAAATVAEAQLIIPEIGEICGTDWIVGTPPERMVKGMGFMRLRFIEFQCMPRPYELLKGTLDKGCFAILRTITKGVPHWIVVVGYTELEYIVFDPWLGPIQYTESELDSVWSPREYQYYEIAK
jgi:hypothetical protein